VSILVILNRSDSVLFCSFLFHGFDLTHQLILFWIPKLIKNN